MDNKSQKNHLLKLVSKVNTKLENQIKKILTDEKQEFFSIGKKTQTNILNDVLHFIQNSIMVKRNIQFQKYFIDLLKKSPFSSSLEKNRQFLYIDEIL